MMHLHDPVPDVRDFRGDVHPEIVDILERCLAKDREDRYQSAAELSADLKRAIAYLGGQPTSIRIPKTDGKAPPPSQPKPSDQAQGKPVPVMQSASQPKPPPARTQAPSAPVTQPKPSSSRRGMWLLGAGLVGILCIAAVLVIGNSLFKGILQASDRPTSTFFPTRATDSTTQSVVLNATETVPPTISPTETAIPTDTAIPLTPTPTTPYVLITGIRIENNKYVVDYEVHNFPQSPSLHVHMFFNTVPPEQAGMPGGGPWKLTWGKYGDPPFTQYGPADRPARATQLCSLVANPNHSIQLGTGNCVDLPQ
jgi:serine/threonine protein kinase